MKPEAQKQERKDQEPVRCPHCDGAGGWDGEFSPLYFGQFTECSFCNGTGFRTALKETDDA